jgi:hypothetical protein
MSPGNIPKGIIELSEQIALGYPLGQDFILQAKFQAKLGDNIPFLALTSFVPGDMKCVS